MSLKTIGRDVLAISKNPNPLRSPSGTFLSRIPKCYKRKLSFDSFFVFGVRISKKHGKSKDWRDQFIRTFEFVFFCNRLTNAIVEGDMIKKIPPSEYFSVAECLECSSLESWRKLRKRLARNIDVKEENSIRKKERKLLKKFLREQKKMT